jgi:hypothetical protein
MHRSLCNDQSRRGLGAIAPFLRLGIFVALVMVAGVAVSGCKRKAKTAVPAAAAVTDPAQAPTSAAANPVNPEAPPDAQEKARVAQAVAMRQGIAPQAPAITLRGGEPATPEVIAAYNQMLARLIFQRRDAPETLQELVRRWPMPKLPTPPPGKQIVYDARNRIIMLYPP